MGEPEELQDILVDEEEVSEKLLASIVGRYLEIGQQSGGLYPKARYEKLDAARKIAVTLLAQKARYELDMVAQQRLGPTEISDLSGVPKGTVFPKVRELEDEAYARSDDGEYWIPNAKIRQVSDYIQSGDDE